MRNVAIVLGIIFAIIAVVYWVVPAGSLPQFVPGFDAGSEHIHLKHGVVAAVAAILLFAAAWYSGRARA